MTYLRPLLSLKVVACITGLEEKDMLAKIEEESGHGRLISKAQHRPAAAFVFWPPASSFPMAARA